MSSMPQVRSPSLQWESGDRVFLIGGWNGSEEVDSVEVYDFTELLVHRISTAHSSLCTQLCSFGDKIFVIGGWKNKGSILSRDVEIYDTTNNSWSLAEPMPTARSYFSAERIGNKIYAIEVGLIRVDPQISKFMKSIWEPGRREKRYHSQ